MPEVGVARTVKKQQQFCLALLWIVTSIDGMERQHPSIKKKEKKTLLIGIRDRVVGDCTY
jgi:hypothetical protein